MELNKINQALLLEVESNGYKVSFDYWDEANMGVFTQNQEAIIYLGTGNNTQEGVTHELLHIKMKSFGYLSANHLRLSSDPKSLLFKVFDKKLCDHISNCMDHIKMYPYFIEYGYASENFLSNEMNEMVSKTELKNIKLKKMWRRSASGIGSFIKHQIAMMSDHQNNDYSVHYEILKNKDAVLFNIVQRFWNNWKSFDITKIDPIFNDDMEVQDDFLNELKSWV